MKIFLESTSPIMKIPSKSNFNSISRDFSIWTRKFNKNTEKSDFGSDRGSQVEKFVPEDRPRNDITHCQKEMHHNQESDQD